MEAEREKLMVKLIDTALGEWARRLTDRFHCQSDADDLIQILQCKLLLYYRENCNWRKLIVNLENDPDDQTEVIKYVRRAFKNDLITHSKKVGRRSEVCEIRKDVEAPADSGKTERIAELMVGMQMLPAVHRLILEMHYFMEMSLESISRMEKAPIGTIKSRLHRARMQLFNNMDSLRN